MEISQSLSQGPINPETMHRSIVLSRTSLDFSKIHLVIPSGKLQLLQTKTGFVSCMFFWCSTFTNHSCSTFWLNPKKRTWLPNGDGTLVKTTSTTATLLLTEDSQLTGTRTIWGTLTPISNSGTRESLWSTPIGGAETRSLESTSTWERGTVWSHPYLASTTMICSRRPRPKTLSGHRSVLINQCFDLKSESI